MAGNDELGNLKAVSTKLRNERRLLLDRLKSFEGELLDSSEGLGCYGSSKSTSLYTWDHEESGVSGGRVGWLHFDGQKLSIHTQSYTDQGHDSEIDEHDLETVELSWLTPLSAPKVLESLITNISKALEGEHQRITTANEWLAEFVAVEKSAIDADLAEVFNQHTNLLESWQKAREAVEIDPENSIARSSSHVETVLKACLKRLGASGYETMPLQKLTSEVIKTLHKQAVLSEGSAQALKGIATIFHGIGTLRNSSSTAHGKNDGYTPPGPDLAQLINHLAGAGSAFVLKQTEKVVQSEQKPE